MALTKKVVLASAFIPVLGLCGWLLYYLFTKDDDTEEEKTQNSGSIVIEVPVPNGSVGSVIGRGGSNIKEVQEKTNTRIAFMDPVPDSDHRVCRIRGLPENAQLAEAFILSSVHNQPFIETCEINVPQKACGRIIGKLGETIRSISKQSNAAVNISRADHEGDFRRVIIKGTAEQIEVAKLLIEEKISEDSQARQKMQQVLSNRAPRNVKRPTTKPEEGEVERRYERLVSTSPNDSMIQVYVSSVADPTIFWLQLINQRAVDLDHLVDEMTEYYRRPESQELHKVTNLEVGQVAAAMFSHDDKWYRVEVMGITPNETTPGESKVDVFYLDYGDSAYVKQKDVCHIRTDFLKLCFQAIECTLSGIRPKGEKWTEESISAFEDLCHTAEWKSMMVQVVGYKEKERRKGEMVSIPIVKIYDPNAQEKDIIRELIERDLAEEEVEDKEENATNGLSDSSTSSYPSSPLKRGTSSPSRL